MNNSIYKRILEKNLTLQFLSHLPNERNTNIIKQKFFQYPGGKKKYIKTSIYALFLSCTFYTPVFSKSSGYYQFTEDIYKQDEKLNIVTKLNPNISKEDIDKKLLEELLNRKEKELEKNCLKRIKENQEELKKQFEYVLRIKLKVEIISSIAKVFTSLTDFIGGLIGGEAIAKGAGLCAEVAEEFWKHDTSNTPLSRTSLDIIIREMRDLEKEYQNLKDGLKREPVAKLEKRYVRQKRHMDNAELQEEIERSLIQARVADYYFQLNSTAIGYALNLPLRPKPLLDPNNKYKSIAKLTKRFYEDKSFSIYTEKIKEYLLNDIIMETAINSITPTSDSSLRVLEHWRGTASTGKSTAAKEVARFLGLPYFEKKIIDSGAEINTTSIFGAQRSFQGAAQLGWLAEALLQEKGQESYQNVFLILDDFPVNDPNAQSLLLNIAEAETKTLYNDFFQAHLNISRLNTIITSNDDFKSLKPEAENDHTFKALTTRFKTTVFPDFNEEQKGILAKPYLEETLVDKYKPPFFYKINYVDPTKIRIIRDPQAFKDMGFSESGDFTILTGVSEDKRNSITVRELKTKLKHTIRNYFKSSNRDYDPLFLDSIGQDRELKVAALKGDPEAITNLVNTKMKSCDISQKKELMRRLGAGHEKSGNVDDAKKCWIESFIKYKDEEIWPQVSKYLPNTILKDVDQQLLESLLTFLKADQTTVHRFAEEISNRLYQIWLQSPKNPVRAECLKYSAALGNKEAFKEIERSSKESKKNLEFLHDVENIITKYPVPYSKAVKILGDMYNQGEFIDIDLTKALYCYEKAIKNGDTSFSYDYSMYLFTKTTQKDFVMELNNGQDSIKVKSDRVIWGHPTSSSNPIRPIFFKKKSYVATIANNRIWLTSSKDSSKDGIDWEKPVQIKKGLRAAQEGISLTSFNGQLYLAYIDNNSIARLVVSKDGTNWKDSTPPSNWSCHQTLSLASFNGQLYLASKGYHTRNIWLTTSSNGTDWEDGKTIIYDNFGHITQKEICLTAFKDKLYLGYIGGAYRHGHCSYTPENMWLTSTEDGKKWEEPRAIMPEKTAEGICLASCGKNLYIAATDSKGIWLTSSEDGTTLKVPVPFQTSSTQNFLAPLLRVEETDESF